MDMMCIEKGQDHNTKIHIFFKQVKKIPLFVQSGYFIPAGYLHFITFTCASDCANQNSSCMRGLTAVIIIYHIYSFI